ncbi:MAG: T9SS type A sorting domain-containing protein [Bacteroidales bacterium]|nr:T9SS type A sorting domain-containing protein [Bacteroidales bacterium]
MKRITAFFAALFLLMGMAQAQDIYFAGNSNGTGKIWKNGSVELNIADSTRVNLQAMMVTPDGKFFSAGYVFDPEFNTQGHVWLNDSTIFDSGTNTIVNDLVVNGNDWIATGFGENEWENLSGFVWQNGVLLHAFNDSIASNQIVSLAIDPATGDIYLGGRSNDCATVWNNDTILWRLNQLSAVNDILFDGGNLYAAGVDYSEGIRATLWQNDSIIFSIDGDDSESEFTVMAFFDGSIYVSGNIDSTLYVWQDGEVLYSHSMTEFSEIKTLVVNDFGIYYAGQIDGTATVWKDGEVLYEIEDCDAISALAVLPSDEPLFTLTVEADSTDWGIVTGGGMYHYGDTATIEAIANAGYEFLFWNDSITDNPCDIIITQDTTFVAHFGQLEYTIATSVSPENAGIVTGGGTYHYGDTITLEAIANGGFAFERWNDSITDNPRDIVVTQDSTFTAFFIERQYTITVESDHPAWGSVTGGGTFDYGDTIQIAATAYMGFQFNSWTDGNADNPRDIVVTEDATYTARFGIQQCEIRAIVSPEGAGTITGAGVYDYGETIHLTVHSNPGYVFYMWDDGNITNPRTVFVDGDAAYTAVFNAVQYEITTEAVPAEGGTVRGAGLYDYGASATLKADANEGYMFICWQDGIASNPRTIAVIQNAHYIAKFYNTGTQLYTVTVVANDPELGTVTGSGTYPEGDSIQISAIPISGALFMGWDDGNTDNPRTVVVTSNLEFKAIFSVTETFTITVKPENPFVGSTYGSGTYPVGTTVNIGATPSQGFYFAGWQDGDMNNPRTLTVTEDADYVAYFSQEPTLTYDVTVYYDENQGFVLGAGTYAAGATATLAAIPADGYMFVKWGDGVTDNRREIVVNQDIVLAVFFDQTGLEDNDLNTLSLFPNPAKEQIRIEGLEGESEIEIYNAMGQLVKAVQLSDNEAVGIGDLSAGLYLMRINGKYKSRFVKE